MINTAPRNTKPVRSKPGGAAAAELTRKALAELLAVANAKGFYGTASLTFSVQDGHVQNARVSSERQVR